MPKLDVKSRANASMPGFTESGEGIFEPMFRLAAGSSPLSLTILLAAPDGLVRSLMADILETHGYKVLNEATDGLSAVVMGQSYPGAIHLLIASMDYRGRGKGPDLAENLAHLRPRMEAVYFSEVEEELWLIRGPGTDAEIRIPFSPGVLLEWIAGIQSSTLR
jgi:DNA-binding NarL/FixJ family response regulator